MPGRGRGLFKIGPVGGPAPSWGSSGGGGTSSGTGGRFSGNGVRSFGGAGGGRGDTFGSDAGGARGQGRLYFYQGEQSQVSNSRPGQSQAQGGQGNNGAERFWGLDMEGNFRVVGGVVGVSSSKGGGGVDKQSQKPPPPTPPPGLKGKDLKAWKKMQMSTELKDNLPRVELDPERRFQITRLLYELDKNNNLTDFGDSDFMRSYKKNLFDNAKAADGTFLTLEHVNKKLGKKPEVDRSLSNQMKRKQQNASYQKMMTIREKLPAYQHKTEFLKMVAENQVIVVSGETGCGKTTQCCQLILDELISQGNGSQCRIVCTQPRRISAISVAERVADERAERIGNSVGYCIRLESKRPSADRGTILFCTTGIIFEYMKDDPTLSQFSHILVDEIHERDVLSDFLLAVLKDLVKIRPDLKVVLMSATINADKFSRYFNNCPCFHIPGYTYPVQEYFLEDVLAETGFVFKTMAKNGGGSSTTRPSYQNKQDYHSEMQYERFLAQHLKQYERERRYPYKVMNEMRKPEVEDLNLDLVEALLLRVCQTDKDNGAVLIFVPGWDEISKLNKQLEEGGRFSGDRYSIIPLHSMINTADQRKAFAKPAAGVRKIIISTNIAETSVTIDDIVHVIDVGRMKVKNFDFRRNIQSLDNEWVSVANATQRKGRAGRVQQGVCYHLFSKARQMVLDNFKKPEILRTRLEEVILRIKLLRLGKSAEFLKRLMDSPTQATVDLAVKRLIKINALDSSENLTPLGFHLAQLPLDPYTGKMILMAGIFSCVDPITTVAAALSFKSPFYTPLGEEETVDMIRQELSKGTKSDHLAIINAMEGWEEAWNEGSARDYCERNYVSGTTLRMLRNMKAQFAHHLHDMKFLTSAKYNAGDSNVHSGNVALIKAMLCAGLYPNVARVCGKLEKDGLYTKEVCRTEEDGKVFLHPKSVNYKQKTFESPYLVYYEKMKTSQVYLYDTTMVSPFPLIFFGGKLELKNWKTEEKKWKILTVDGYHECLIDKPTFDLVLALRNRLDKLLEHKIANPGPTCWNEMSNEGALLRAITQLITAEYHEMCGE